MRTFHHIEGHIVPEGGVGHIDGEHGSQHGRVLVGCAIFHPASINLIIDARQRAVDIGQHPEAGIAPGEVCLNLGADGTILYRGLACSGRDVASAGAAVDGPRLHLAALHLGVHPQRVQLLACGHEVLSAGFVDERNDVSRLRVYLDAIEVCLESVVLEGDVLLECAFLRGVNVECLVAACRNVVADELHLPSPSWREALAPDNLCGIGLAFGVAHQHRSLQSIAREDGAEGIEVAPPVEACGQGQVVGEDLGLHQRAMLIGQEVESHDGLSCAGQEGDVVHISTESIVAVLAGRMVQVVVSAHTLAV